MTNSSKVNEAQFNEVLNLLADRIRDYNWVKENLVLQCISATDNTELLKEVPYVLKEDLAFIVRLNVTNDVSLPIRNFMFYAMGVDKDTLFRDALALSKEKHPMEILTFSEVLGFVPEESPNMLICTIKSEQGIYSRYGACCLLYPEFVKKAREACQGNFYILPSSKHEVILVKYDEKIEKKFLLEVVKNVNVEEFDPQDKLTDSIYLCKDDENFYKIM